MSNLPPIPGQKIEPDYKKCRTLNELFKELDKHYDLDEPKSEMIIAIVQKAMPRLLKLTSTKPR